jgi:hypothetical protein
MAALRGDIRCRYLKQIFLVSILKTSNIPISPKTMKIGD